MNWKVFIIPVVVFAILLAIPTPYGMKDVAVEYKVAPSRVIDMLANDIFGVASNQAEQWQLLTAQIIEARIGQGAMGKARFMKTDTGWLKSMNIPGDSKNLEKALTHVNENYTDETYRALTQKAFDLAKKDLKFEELEGKEKSAAEKGAWHIKVAIAAYRLCGALLFDGMYSIAGSGFLHRAALRIHRCGNALRSGNAVLGRRLLGLSWDRSCSRRLS